jgi:hypothetical protein
MSDINELIATNTVRAFNQGLQFGAMEERERIIELLESHSHETEQESRDCDVCERYYGVGLALALIEGEQK